VLDFGKGLYKQFCTIRRFIARLNRKLSLIEDYDDPNESFSAVTTLPIKSMQRKQEKLHAMLKAFDEQWALYEKSYVFELMVIERDARRFII
jgi:hypothetical protein